MTYHESAGHTGARVQSYESGARKLLRDMLVENSDLTLDEFLAARDEHEDGEHMRRAMELYWFTNACTSLARDPLLSRDRYAKGAAKRKAQAKQIEEIAKAGASKTLTAFLFLANPMPNGKALRYCTGKEVASFGALYVKLAKTLKADQRVGDVYRTDAEIMKLYKA